MPLSGLNIFILSLLTGPNPRTPKFCSRERKSLITHTWATLYDKLLYQVIKDIIYKNILTALSTLILKENVCN